MIKSPSNLPNPRKPSLPDPHYRGRFAPSPTGELHLGSLLTAFAGFIDARSHQGRWLLRIEDLDIPRCSQQASASIMRILEAHQLHWDNNSSTSQVLFQSQRSEIYQSALNQLIDKQHGYRCQCTRKQLKNHARYGIDGLIYPGNCRHQANITSPQHAWRVYTDDQLISFSDRLQGKQDYRLASQCGDFVIKRADQLFAYQLAVVVDDWQQQINQVVRGIDLLHSTPRQIHLQHLLNYSTPTYMHLPIVINKQGEKLSKQTRARPVSPQQAAPQLFNCLKLLCQSPPQPLQYESVSTILEWAIAHWNPAQLIGKIQCGPENTSND